MAGKAKITLKQKLTNTKIGKGSSISQGGKRKFKVTVPFKVTVTMRQRSENSNVAMHQGGSVKIAMNKPPKKEEVT